MTHAQQLVQAVRRARSKGLTYGELQDLHVSTAPHKRLDESGWRYLRAGEVLARKTGRDGLVRFVVARG